ncbi:hypothetical protein BHM03_00030575 [Ensete ventricosum]|nr:hypothetical protein BHM03_00030575 [Ensete ventricosum]
MDGIVVFADDSNVHSVDMFDEAQKVKWMGAVSIGILAHTGRTEAVGDPELSEEEDKEENYPVPIQGPACNSSGDLVGWHTYNALPHTGAAFVGAGRTMRAAKMEWAGFVLNSRLLWREAEGKPDWVRDLDAVGEDGEEIENPLALLKDASFVEPLGNCGKKVLLWWLRVEARYDSKFPSGWAIDSALEITVAAKQTPWIDSPPELPSEMMAIDRDMFGMKLSRKSMASWTSHISHDEEKHDSSSVDADQNYFGTLTLMRMRAYVELQRRQVGEVLPHAQTLPRWPTMQARAWLTDRATNPMHCSKGSGMHACQPRGRCRRRDQILVVQFWLRSAAIAAGCRYADAAWLTSRFRMQMAEESKPRGGWRLLPAKAWEEEKKQKAGR